MNNLPNKGAMGVEEFLHWANIGRSKFYQLVADGSISMKKIGRKSVITINDANEWLNDLPEASKKKS